MPPEHSRADNLESQDKTRITSNRLDALKADAPSATITGGAPDLVTDAAPEHTADPFTAAMREHLGTIIAGRYRIITLLGVGGMGSVFKAEHIMLGNPVAVKILNRDLAENTTALKRFAQEAKAASSLKHSNIAAVSDYGLTESGAPYFVMDMVEGTSLADLVEKAGPLPWQLAVELGIQVADAIAYAHFQGIVHRDLKPANIIVSKTAKGDERATVVDFGIAKIANDTQDAQKLTQTGEVFGSPLYMSPEQCTGKSMDSRSDIYSFGCMMYEVLTGDVPFLGENAVQTILMQINEPPPSMRSKQAQQTTGPLPNGLETVILHCLEKDPAARYSSMDAVKADLVLVKKGLPPTKKSVKRLRFKMKAPGLMQTGLVTAIGTITMFLGMAFWYSKWQYEFVPWQKDYNAAKKEFERTEYQQAVMSAQHGIKVGTAKSAPKHEIANLYMILGDAYKNMDERDYSSEARQAYEHAVKLADGKGAAKIKVHGHQRLGDMSKAKGDFKTALKNYETALASFSEKYEDDAMKARLHLRKSIALENLGDTPSAIKELEEAAKIYRAQDSDSTPALIATLEKLSAASKATGDAAHALQYSSEAETLRAAFEK